MGILITGGCSGGGGGGGSSAPTLVSAVFVGAGATPAPGDVLQLLFSENVVLVSGAAIGDDDLALSPSGSVGAAGTPTLSGTRLVVVPLGTGVAFAPGTTTVDIATTDAVQDADGNLATSGAPVVITAGDGDAPTITNLTLNDIVGSLNGTGAAGGTLQVPRSGFTIDVAYSDTSSQVDPNLTVVTADVAVSTAAGSVSAGGNLLAGLSVAGDASEATLTVPATTSFPVGTVTLSVTVRDTTGMSSAPATFSFLVKNLDDNVRPFETGTNAQQTWFIDLSRDIESYTVNLANGSLPVGVSAGANGRPDIEDLFRVVGIHNAAPIANVSGSMDSNQVVTEQFKARMLVVLNRVYDGAPVAFTFTSPGAFPGGQSSVPYANLGFSQICVAGAESAAGNSLVLGVAIFDPLNDNQNNNCLTDFQGTQRLGVFMHTAVNEEMKDGMTLFHQLFDSLTPSRMGTPIGDDAQDGARLLNPAQDARAAAMEAAIHAFANMTAIILAHEAGHSVGLVTNNPMPAGLYGNLAAFPGSSDGHIRNSDFPAGSTNVMSPSLSFEGTQPTASGFNTLNQAYLRERVVQDR